MMLYCPWRNEIKELESSKTAERMYLLYQERYLNIDKNRKMFEVGDIDTVEDIQIDVEETMHRKNWKNERSSLGF